MAFSFTWNGAFLAEPADNENINLGASRIRNLKSALTERLVVDHAWTGTADDGKHNQATLRAQTLAPTLTGTDGALFSQTIAGNTELFYEDNFGRQTQITSVGAVDVPMAAEPPVALLVTASSTVTLAWPRVKITAVGSGGGGGGGKSDITIPTAGGGGGGGAVGVTWLTGLTVGGTLAVVIGTQGLGGVGGASPADGSAGGDTTVSSGTQSIATLTAPGGTAGQRGLAIVGGDGGDISATSTGFYLDTHGGHGGFGGAGAGVPCAGGVGGATAGIGAQGFGGGGGRADTGAGIGGDNGVLGFVLIEYF